jgi:predicted Fe-Mo cluster-binding NifX family protein
MTTTAEIVCVPVTAEGDVDRRWGKAERVAIARVVDGAVTDWQVLDVGWDHSHAVGPEGHHHGRIVGFLRDHDVSLVVAGGMGPPMQHTLSRLGVRIVLGAQGDARTAVLRGVVAGAPAGAATG